MSSCRHTTYAHMYTRSYALKSLWLQRRSADARPRELNCAVRSDLLIRVSSEPWSYRLSFSELSSSCRFSGRLAVRVGLFIHSYAAIIRRNPAGFPECTSIFVDFYFGRERPQSFQASALLTAPQPMTSTVAPAIRSCNMFYFPCS